MGKKRKLTYDKAIEDISPQKGDLVSVCYDGKWGRAVKGTVLQHRGFAILVEFNEWAEENNKVKAWFVRTSPRSFSAFVKVENSLMKMMWGLKGDYYCAFSIKVFEFVNQD